MTTFASSFSTPGTPDHELVGRKGADLARMVQLGLPVPPGFTLTTAAGRRVRAEGAWPPGMEGDVARLLAQVEEETGTALGDQQRPLLLAVRSGSWSAPARGTGTVLDIGLNEVTVEALARSAGDERFAWDCYRRFVETFGVTVLGVPEERFDEVVAAMLTEHGATDVDGLDGAALRSLVARAAELCEQVSGRSVPGDPREQLRLAIDAAFAAPDEPATSIDGTAVEVEAMVFGNRGERSGSGVAHTRDPATGDLGDHGEYRAHVQGADGATGARTAAPLARLRELDLSSYRRLRSIMGTLERHYRDLCTIEFTIEEGRLWILRATIGERTPRAAFRIAVDLVDEGMITEDEALVRVTGEQLALVRAGGQVADPALDRAVERVLAHAARVLGSRSPDDPVARLESARALLMAEGCSAERFDVYDAPLLTPAG